MTNPTAALLIIGNEILSGRTQDKNINYVACGLNKIGITLAEVRVIPDIESTIISTLNALRSSYNYVFTTGGIGPTHDDITAESVAKAFDVALEQNPDAIKCLENHYKDPSKLTGARLRMANIPASGSLINNPISGAPGFNIENVYVMAGVPNIMQAMFDHVLPSLKGGDIVISQEIRTYVAEGTLAEQAASLQTKYPDIDIGSYPTIHENRLATSLVFRSTNKAQVEKAKEEMLTYLHSINAELF